MMPVMADIPHKCQLPTRREERCVLAGRAEKSSAQVKSRSEFKGFSGASVAIQLHGLSTRTREPLSGLSAYASGMHGDSRTMAKKSACPDSQPTTSRQVRHASYL